MFLHDWNDVEDVKESFEISDVDLLGVRILLASYESDGCDGYAFVLFVCDGKLFEVNGSVCSIYDLEEQWLPEETSVEELRHRLKEGLLGSPREGCGGFAQELSKVLDECKS